MTQSRTQPRGRTSLRLAAWSLLALIGPQATPDLGLLPGGSRPWGARLAAQDDDSPVSLEVLLERSTIAAGGELRVALVVSTADGWHFYHETLGPPDAIGAPTRVEISAPDVSFGKVRFPEPEKIPQPGLGKDGGDTWIYAHHGRVTLYALGKIAAGVSGGRELEVRVSGLACKLSCIPFELAQKASFSVGAEPSEAAHADVFKAFPEEQGPAEELPAATAGSAPAATPRPLEAPPADLGLGSLDAAPFADPKAGPGGPLPGLPAGLAPGARTSSDGAPVSLEVLLERGTVLRGGELRAALVLDVADGWHIYHETLGPPDAVGSPTTVRLQAEGVAFSKARFPEPERVPQPGLGKDGGDTWIHAHHGRVILYALGKLAEEASGPREVRVEVGGLACKQSCVPFDLTGTASFSVGAPASAAAHPAVFRDFPGDLRVEPGDGGVGEGVLVDGAVPPGDGETVSEGAAAASFTRYEARQAEESRSFVAYILLGLLAGFILNFMPCVLPVISIKVLSFVQQAGEDRRRVFRLGLTFAAGILTVFLVLAALAAFAGQSWGDQFQSQTFLVIMIGIVFAFSLSLFGVYDIGVPASVANVAGANFREGYGDAFFKGVMATILATPCSGPFLGSTLAWALVQNTFVVFSIFTAIGVGMALPYVFLTAKPGWLSVLPRPGAWMETFKQIMGFLLLLTVVFLMISLQQDLLLFTVTFLLFVAIAAWAYGRWATYRHGALRRFAVLGASVGIVWLGAYLSFVTFQGLFAVEASGLQWKPFTSAALERLHSERRNVLVDWTADWCPNCKFVERFVLESEEMRALIGRKEVVTLKADITHDTPETRVMKRLRDQLGTRSIPFLAVFPADDPYRPYVLRDIYTQGDLRVILEALP